MSEHLDETQIEALFTGKNEGAATVASRRLTADEGRGLRSGAVVVLDRAVDDPLELLRDWRAPCLWAAAALTESVELTETIVEDMPEDITQDDGVQEGRS